LLLNQRSRFRTIRKARFSDRSRLTWRHRLLISKSKRLGNPSITRCLKGLSTVPRTTSRKLLTMHRVMTNRQRSQGSRARAKLSQSRPITALRSSASSRTFSAFKVRCSRGTRWRPLTLKYTENSKRSCRKKEAVRASSKPESHFDRTKATRWKAAKLSLFPIQIASWFRKMMKRRVTKSLKSVTLTWFLSRKPKMKITRLPAK
jgi:hypothetical protein